MSFKIDCNNDMTITAGDTGFINYRCANYKLKKGDSVIFTVHNNKIHGNLFAIQVNEFTQEGVASIQIVPSQSAQELGTYEYTIRVITALGVDETTTIGKFTIIKEV